MAAADRDRRQERGGESEDRAFEDGRVLTFYEVIRELWLIAREHGLYRRGLGAPEWPPDDVSLLGLRIRKVANVSGPACSSNELLPGARGR